MFFCLHSFITVYCMDPYNTPTKLLDRIDWASNTSRSSVEDMRINHRRRDIVMSQKFLDNMDSLASFEQMCGNVRAFTQYCVISPSESISAFYTIQKPHRNDTSVRGYLLFFFSTIPTHHQIAKKQALITPVRETFPKQQKNYVPPFLLSQHFYRICCSFEKRPLWAKKNDYQSNYAKWPYCTILPQILASAKVAKTHHRTVGYKIRSLPLKALKSL